ncbi:hypothetical protein ACEPAH_3704 [Sanghuangporus vaninii]
MDAESEELVKFREQWKAEIKQRSTHSHVSPSVDGKPLDYSLPSVPAHLFAVQPRIPGAQTLSRSLVSAVETYRLAIQYEQTGDLDEALRLYRNAFKLDSNVDKAYRREELRLAGAALRVENGHVEEHSRWDPFSAEKALTRSRSKARPIVGKCLHTGALMHLLSSFPDDLDFIPLDEASNTPLRLVPDEIIVLILKMLDPHSIERFALLSRKARVLSLDSSIWRDLVQKTYMPPQIPHDSTIEELADRYTFDYRRFYIEHPRLRLDGVYIAVCHYVRPGLNSDNVWVNVSHLITYHRYLRFFADGTVISLLANEDVEPQTVIPLLKPSLRMKGLFIGSWSLEGATICIRDLTDPNRSNLRYTFRMILTLKSKPLGRWNKLDLSGYDSINKENGEAIPLGLKHERPFWFSKVRSYVA